MAEIFERHTPDLKLGWTGERLTTGVSGQVEIEHLHRYFFARAICRDLDVLDVASGEGYGTALLAQVARSVVGVEISGEAVEHARSAYEKPGLRFLKGDARQIELPDHSFDVVVSFETIEHFYEHEAFIGEIKRVLRPGGILIISSPDRDVYSRFGRPPNPFHIRELNRLEFESLLETSFRHVSIYSQRAMLGGAIFADSSPANSTPLITFERRGERQFEASGGLPRAVYLVAVASDSPVAYPLGSLFVESDDLESVYSQSKAGASAEEWRQKLLAANAQAEEWRQTLLSANDQAEEWRQRLLTSDERGEFWRRKALASEAELEELRTDVSAVRADRADLGQRLGALEARHAVALADLRRREDLLKGQQISLSEQAARCSDYERRLNAVLESRSWQLTAPLRRVSLAVRPSVGFVRGRFFSKSGISSGHLMSAAAASAPDAMLPDATSGRSDPGLSATAIVEREGSQSWLFLGDTIQWLKEHGQLTGVGRVTTELFFASLSDRDSRMLPCVWGEGDLGLAGLSLRAAISSIASCAGTHSAEELLEELGPLADQLGPERPVAGDHILFSGVVWTSEFAALFRRMVEQGMNFSVVLHDIIPLTNPEFVSEDHARMFAEWLRTVLSAAAVVFVSSPITRDQVYRWAALFAVPVGARVRTIEFGSISADRFLSADQLAARMAGARVRLDSFVLSVGTIDRRKNQLLLCRIWKRLIEDLGRFRVPQLVLVGRDDLQLASSCESVGELFRTSDIVILDRVDDTELASLYRLCLFTAFPSLSEGYGLPVSESLHYGKLCVSSDLKVIKEHSGHLPWYFDPSDDEAAYSLFRRAIIDADARAGAELLISRDLRERSWFDTCMSIVQAMASQMRPSSQPFGDGEYRPIVPGLKSASTLTALDAAAEWCTEVDPEVSIVLVNWNACGLTRECVRQIWANTTGIRYEIVIADNGSDPGQLQSLEVLGGGVRLLPLGANRYFGEANNIATENAKGRYICLLNNDAFVQPGWLRPLIDSLEDDPEAGAAGPLFLFPDGTIQEAGAEINEYGYPVRYGRGQSPLNPEFLEPKYVDYISAAALVLSRSLFLEARGFDLAYEPAYYEDADLCLKIRALGRRVKFVPESRVTHLEGASATGDPTAEERRRALGDLNREKFIARWGGYLKNRTPHELTAVAGSLSASRAARADKAGSGPRRTAALFTSYPLTPGGGERFLLSTASALSRDYVVTLVTPHPYSHLRLQGICHELDIQLSDCRLATISDMLRGPAPDVMIAMGNHLVPPIPGPAKNNIFLCQFPFPSPELNKPSELIGEYGAVITYSEYTRAHIIAGLSANQLPSWPVEVVYPPVPQLGGSAIGKKNVILSVGRFFGGGHSKRQDLLVSAFRTLVERFDGDLELHLAGSSVPLPEQMDYLEQLRRSSRDLPIVFHVNASNETLKGLYRDAAVYWHAAGMGANLAQEPEAAEHFGISVVEAMSAACLPIAFNAGGPREIIDSGVNGFLYSSMDELAELTYLAFSPGFLPRREAMGEAAMRRASAFSIESFGRAIRRVIERTERV